MPVGQGEEGGAEERDAPAEEKGCDDSGSTHDDWVVDGGDDDQHVESYLGYELQYWDEQEAAPDRT